MSGARTSFAVALVIVAGIGFWVSAKPVTDSNLTTQEEEEPKIVELIAFKSALTNASNSRMNKETQIDKLMRERTESTQRELELRIREFRVGRGTLDVLLECSRNAKNSGLDLAINKEQELEIRRGYLSLMTYIYNLNKDRYEVGAVRQQDFESTMYAKLDAEIQLLKAGGK